MKKEQLVFNKFLQMKKGRNITISRVDEMTYARNLHAHLTLSSLIAIFERCTPEKVDPLLNKHQVIHQPRNYHSGHLRHFAFDVSGLSGHLQFIRYLSETLSRCRDVEGTKLFYWPLSLFLSPALFMLILHSQTGQYSHSHKLRLTLHRARERKRERERGGRRRKDSEVSERGKENIWSLFFPH